MKIGKLRTFWIILLSALYIANLCGQAIFMQMRKKITRKWVDGMAQAWARRILNLVKVKCVVINLLHIEPKPGQATIIMCNHSSLYDIPLSFNAFPSHSIRMLAKKELSKIPLMGQGMVAAEFPFVDRHNRSQAILDLEAIQHLLKSGIIMWIAPEGTRSKDGKLAKFKKGGFITAIKSNAVIIPIGIRGANKILPARTLQLNLNQTAEIHIGQPVDASQYSLDEKDILIEKVFAEMKQLIGEA